MDYKIYYWKIQKELIGVLLTTQSAENFNLHL